MAAAGTPSSRGLVNHHVPNYDIFGHQHHRHPFKDKAFLMQEDVRHHKWLQPTPAVNTREKLIKARQQGRVPDLSYDFDGDGVVGETDYFTGKFFDKDKDGRLSTAEREDARQQLDAGFLSQYIKAEHMDAEQKANLAQAKRNILAAHSPQHKKGNPVHSTRTSLKLCRSAEAKASAQFFGERYAQECAPVLEPHPPTHETHPRSCPIANIRERAEADHQESRVRGGLMPMNTVVNPEREMKSVGMDFVERPHFATRGQLNETRKEFMKRECEELAQKAEEVAVPSSVRRVEREVREFEFRRAKGDTMTMTRLKDQRRKDRVEHDMTNFTQPRGAREYPRFSDNPEVPFWLADQPLQTMGATAPPAMSRAVSEPSLKVTDVPWGHNPGRASHSDLPETAHAMAAAGRAASKAADRMGSKTVKRWTAESIERGEGRNKPRLFDNIQPVRIGPKDLESLDFTSSMEPIRQMAVAKMKGEADGFRGAPKRSILWNEPQTAQSAGVSHDRGLSAGTVEETVQVKRPVGRNVISSDMGPMRAAVQRDESSHEPRFFGSTQHIARPSHQTAVRSGGFQLGVTSGKGHLAQTKHVRGKGLSQSGALRSDFASGDHSKGEPVP